MKRPNAPALLEPTEQMVFTFPMPDRVLYANGRGHWAVKHKAKKALWDMCDILVAGGIFPKPPKKPWDKAIITGRLTLGNPMDDDNAINRTKVLTDFLVTRGYLVDDSKKHLSWGGIPEQRVSRKNTPEIELTLTRVRDSSQR